jgi:lysophospholipase L1-like esterase
MRIAGLGEVMTYRPDPDFGYLMRPSQRISTYGRAVEINSLGLRGPEPLDPKPADVRRLLFLGDSITYGGGQIAESELFCRRVESLAARDGLRVESLNGSAPGWSPQNWAAWVGANGTLGADVVVAVIPAIDRARPFATVSQHDLLERAPLLRLSALWLRLRSLGQAGPPLSDEAMAANARAISQMLPRLGSTPLLAVFVPSRGADERPERWAPYQALFPDALDLRADFSPADFLDDVHFSSSGHRTIAERIYARLRPRLADSPVARVSLALELQALPPPDE